MKYCCYYCLFVIVDIILCGSSKHVTDRASRDSICMRGSVMADSRKVLELERRIVQLDSRCAALRSDKPGLSLF